MTRTKSAQSHTSRTTTLPHSLYRRLPFSKLKPAPYNPRVALKPGDPTFEKLRRSIETFGCVEPIVWNKRTGFVVGGHQRLEVLKQLGHTSVDVVEVNLTPDREKALNLALNKIVGAWDEQKLADLLQDLTSDSSFDLDLTGFELGDVDTILGSIAASSRTLGNDADFDLDRALQDGSARPPITKPGELLVLGQHRLFCGDATKPEDVRRLMAKQKAILFATDPPYLVDYNGTNHPGINPRKRNKDWSSTYGVTWDDADANPELYNQFVQVAVAEAIDSHAAWYCWHASRRQAMLESAWEKAGAFVHNQIIWAKNRPVLTRSWYMWKHEPCFFGWLKGNKPPRVAKETLPTVWTIDTIPNGAERPDHPTPKPLEVFELPMQQHTKVGDICYEPFCGSGTQLIAAEKLGRRCFALEISPRYCDLIVRRWIHLVGAKNVDPALVKRFSEQPPAKVRHTSGPLQTRSEAARSRRTASRKEAAR